MSEKTGQGWTSYCVLKHEVNGYAYAEWNKDTMVWEQRTIWFAKFSNLKRHVLKKYGHHIG